MRELLAVARNTAFVLVYEKLCHGGIETMILRLSKKIYEIGSYACIVCKEGGDLDEAASKYADIFYQRSLSDIHQIAQGILAKSAKYKTIVILSFDTGASTRAVYLEQFLAKHKQVKNITGIFHPNAYFMPGQPADRVFLNKITLSLYGASNTFFMNEECKLSHEIRFRIGYDLSPVIILPVIDGAEYVSNYKLRSTAKNTLKILSVGRIVAFKAYNRGAPAIINYLKASGVNAEWDIYGYGPEEETIKISASNMGVSDQLHLLGLLPYGMLSAIVNDYDIFVGMGTAAIEAAASGLPSICAIIDQEDGSYGFVHELPLGNVGEVIPHRKILKIADLLMSFQGLQPDEKLSHVVCSFEYCRHYDIESFLLSVMAMTEYSNPVKRSIRRRAISRFICEITEGRLRSIFFNKGIKTRLVQALRKCG